MTSKNSGHAAHIEKSSALGLPGSADKPIKVAMIGAGSVFTPRLISDILQIPNNLGGEFVLVDTDTIRLKQMTVLVERLIEQMQVGELWKVAASSERREVLAGSDYIVVCIEVSGLECVHHDNDIPLRYGIDQCIGDTIGPGGLFKALRTIPHFLGILKDAEELCPDAIVLNYTNPMSMLCLAAARTSPMKVVGLCHSIQSTTKMLAERLDLPLDSIEWDCAGVNHLAWVTTFKHRGQDLLPRLKKMAQSDLSQALAEGWEDPEGDCDPRDLEIPQHHQDLVRKDILLQFGAYVTESSGHVSEYLPYYRKNPAVLKQFMRPGYFGGSRFYASNWPTWRANNDQEREDFLSGAKPMSFPRSWEYASWIIEARMKDTPTRIYGNVSNHAGLGGALISNLPQDGCVEVACMVDRSGIHPVRHGRLPAQLAALSASNMAVFDLGVAAALESSKEAAIHALMLDPLTSAVCSTADIRKMTLELFEAEKAYLPKFH